MGGRTLRMDALRELYAGLGLTRVQTYVQSGNVVFHTRGADLAKLGKRLEDAIEEMAGYRSRVFLRTTADLRGVVERNPFAGRDEIPPKWLLVHFLGAEPAADAHGAVAALDREFPEELRLSGRELYVYYKNSVGESKLSPTRVDKAIGMPTTARNWNTVTKLLAMAEELETA